MPKPKSEDDQVARWAAGELVGTGEDGHGPVADCCPDFSCCYPPNLASLAEREAYLNGLELDRERLAVAFYLRGIARYNNNEGNLRRRRRIARLSDSQLTNEPARTQRKRDRDSSPCPLCVGPVAVDWANSNLKAHSGTLALKKLSERLQQPRGYPKGFFDRPTVDSETGEIIPNPVTLPAGVPWTFALLRCRICHKQPGTVYATADEDTLDAYTWDLPATGDVLVDPDSLSR